MAQLARWEMVVCNELSCTSVASGLCMRNLRRRQYERASGALFSATRLL